MIKKLLVRNFRSLRRLDVDLGLNNVLVGPNASGKTNIIEAFKFLTAVSQVGLKKAFTDRFGFSEVQWKGKDSGPIYFLIEAEVAYPSIGPTKFEYEVEIDGTPLGLITVLRERLTFSNHGKRTNIIDFSSGRGVAKRPFRTGLPACGAGSECPR